MPEMSIESFVDLMAQQFETESDASKALGASLVIQGQ
jgi:hypothetical protein